VGEPKQNQEEPKVSDSNPVFDALRPPVLPSGLANLDRAKINEWDTKLKSLDSNAPSSSELFEVLLSQQSTLENHAQVIAAVVGNMEKTMPQINAISKAIQARSEQAQQQVKNVSAQAPAQPITGGGIGDIMPLILKALGDGNAAQPANSELTSFFIQMGKESMMQNQAIGKAIIAKITGEAAAKITTDVVAKV
jgi:hypothetical protein